MIAISHFLGNKKGLTYGQGQENILYRTICKGGKNFKVCSLPGSIILYSRCFNVILIC